jgi:hypothetical protein
MISCKRAAELTSWSLDTPLSRWQRFAWVVHLCLCSMCRRYRRQSAVIQHAGRFAGLADWITGTSEACLSEAARARIKQALSQEGPGGPG